MKIINETRFFGMLGFAMRAGKVEVGVDVVCSLMPKGTVKLVIIASDASDAIREKIRKKCDFYNIEFIEPELDSEILSRRLGKMSTTVCVAIKDEAFKGEILRTLEEQ